MTSKCVKKLHYARMESIGRYPTQSSMPIAFVSHSETFGSWVIVQWVKHLAIDKTCTRHCASVLNTPPPTTALIDPAIPTLLQEQSKLTLQQSAQFLCLLICLQLALSNNS